MDKTQAKFMCQRVDESKYAGGKSTKIVLTAVTPYNSDWDSKVFWDATPSGTVELQVVNERAIEYFEPGQKYYVDFIKADS